MPAAPAVPFRGIQPFRYVDHAIFLAREEETDELEDLVTIHRGVFLYGASGDGKSSLINAGLLPAVARRRLRPERVRVQPRRGEEIVVERIARTEDGDDQLPSLLVPDGDASARVVMSAEAFADRVRAVCAAGERPLLIFDQFEEVITLFEEPGAGAIQRVVAEMLVALLREPIAVKLLFVFREDYLSKVKRLMAAAPELVDQALHLAALSADKLPAIIRGPFERHPGHFIRELDPDLVERLCADLVERFGSAEISLSEVETVALRLWQSDDPHALLETRRVQGLLEDYLGEALEGFPADQRAAAIALLAQMVTAAGTRNVISAEDLVQRVQDDDPALSSVLLSSALDRLERRSRLIRRERRRDIYFYEIASEFLVPWISERREQAARDAQRARDRRRYVVLASIVGALLVVVAVVAVVAIWALRQRAETQREASNVTSLGLASIATAEIPTRPGIALLLGLAAYRQAPLVEARSAMLSALIAARTPGLLAILHGHTDAVNGVAFSRDGRTLASGGDDGTIRLWDAHAHRQLGRPLDANAGAVTDVAFSPDGRTLAAAAEDGSVRLWDPRTRRQLGVLRGTSSVLSVAFSPDGRTLASVEDRGTIRLWSLRARKQIRAPLRGDATSVLDVQFSPDGRTLASAGNDTTIRLWDLRARRPRDTRLAGRATTVAFSPDGRVLASGGVGRAVRLWSPRTHEEIGELRGHTGAVEALAFTPDGRSLASAGDDRTIRLWNPHTHEQLGAPLEGHTSAVKSLAFSPDGRTLASASQDNTVRIWSPAARPRLDTPLVGHADSVNGVAYSPDGRTLASASDDGTARLWDLRAQRQLGPPLRVGSATTVQSVAFSPNGRILATADGFGDSTIRLWNPHTHEQLGAPLIRDAAGFTGVAFSPDGRTLASAGRDGLIRLWDPRSRTQLGTPLDGHAGAVNGVAFSPDGRTIAAAGDDGTVLLWRRHRLSRLGRRREGRIVHAVAFSPDGRTIAASEGNTIRLWSTRTHELLFTPLKGHDSDVYGVAFSPDGRTLASASEDGTVRLWDPRTHKLGAPLQGHAGPVSAVAFSPDGRTLATANDDHTILLWKGLLWRSEGELQTEVCHLVGGGLSTAEWNEFVGDIGYRRVCP